MIDFNCFTGTWPFHKMMAQDFSKLRELHVKNNITTGYISSLNSIFYNDIYESEKELYETIKDTDYKQVITVNPIYPGFEHSLIRCIKKFDVRGVKIFPSIHSYRLLLSNLNPLTKILREYNLPLFISFKTEEEDNSYLYKQTAFSNTDVYDLEDFISYNRDIPMLICNANYPQLQTLKQAIKDCPLVFYDTSGLKGSLLDLKNMEIIKDRLVYGSHAPFYSIKSTTLLVDYIADEGFKSQIMSGKNFLNAIK